MFQAFNNSSWFVISLTGTSVEHIKVNIFIPSKLVDVLLIIQSTLYPAISMRHKSDISCSEVTRDLWIYCRDCIRAHIAMVFYRPSDIYIVRKLIHCLVSHKNSLVFMELRTKQENQESSLMNWWNGICFLSHPILNLMYGSAAIWTEFFCFQRIFE